MVGLYWGFIGANIAAVFLSGLNKLLKIAWLSGPPSKTNQTKNIM